MFWYSIHVLWETMRAKSQNIIRDVVFDLFFVVKWTVMWLESWMSTKTIKVSRDITNINNCNNSKLSCTIKNNIFRINRWLVLRITLLSLELITSSSSMSSCSVFVTSCIIDIFSWFQREILWIFAIRDLLTMSWYIELFPHLTTCPQLGYCTIWVLLIDNAVT